MTSNRRRKKDVRARAESAGTNYTTALRGQQAHWIYQPDAKTAERDLLGQLRELWPAAFAEPQQLPPAPAGPGIAAETVIHGYPTTGTGEVVLEDPDGRELGTLPYYPLHAAPGGFAWGYGGAGPADLARSILIAVLGEASNCPTCAGTARVLATLENGKFAYEPYTPARVGTGLAEVCHHCEAGIKFPEHVDAQAFKWEYVAAWPQEQEFRVTAAEVRAWIERVAARSKTTPHERAQQATKAAEARRPSWYVPEQTPKALPALAGLLAHGDDRPRLGWRVLIRALAKTRSRLIAEQAAKEAVDVAAAALDDGAGAYEAAGQLGTNLEHTRLHFVRLAVHALAAAAGETEPDEMPEQFEMGEPSFAEAVPAIPRALAARYALAEVKAAMPRSGETAADLEKAYFTEFSTAVRRHEGWPGVDPKRADEEESLGDRISRAWIDESDEQVEWADAVCLALAGELRELLNLPRIDMAADDQAHNEETAREAYEDPYNDNPHEPYDLDDELDQDDEPGAEYEG